MLTVPEVAKRVGRDPETVRRWIRSGKLPARKVGTQHVVEESDVEGLLDGSDQVALPEGWGRLPSGASGPDWVGALDEVRRGR